MRQTFPDFLFQFNHPASLDLSIIIVSFNTRKILLDCLRSVYAQTSGVSFEVFVIDNASKDGSVQAVAEHFPEVFIIQNSTNRGFSSAHNQGIMKSRGRHIALLNSDTVLVENCFLKIICFLENHPEFSICTPQIINEDNHSSSMRLWEDSPIDAMKKILGMYDVAKEAEMMGKIEPKEVEAIGGSCFVVRRNLFEKIGFLDENYFLYNEEDDFCRRARQIGQKVCYYPEASIQHLRGKSTHLPSVREKVIIEAYKSNLYFYAKYYSVPWNILLRFLYRCTFLVATMKLLWNRLAHKNSGSVDNSISLYLKLFFMNPAIPTPHQHHKHN